MNADVLDEGPPEKTHCGTCGALSPRAPTCPVCGDAQAHVKSKCIACRAPMRTNAERCPACQSHQNWRRHVTFSQTTLLVVTLFFSVLSSLISAVPHVVDRHSRTSLTVTGGDGKAIYVGVTNTGRKPSVLLGFRLKFHGPAIEDVTLDLIDADKPDAKNIIPAGGAVNIGLTAPGLAVTRSKPEIAEWIRGREVTLETEVRESNDPVAGRAFHRRSDTFPADRIEEFILLRVPVE